MTTIRMNKRVRMSRIRGRRDRRGMLLMIVLGLLALFAMIGVSFVLITSDADRSAKATLSVTEKRQSSTELLGEAAMRVFRGTNAAAWDDRPIGTHNLLTDMYGSPSSNNLTNASGSVFALQVGVVDGNLLLNADSWTNILAKLYVEEQSRLQTMVVSGELTSTLMQRYLQEYEANLPYRLMSSYLGLSNGDIYQVVSMAGNAPLLRAIYLMPETRKVFNAGNGMAYEKLTYSLYKPFGGTGLTQVTAPFAWTTDKDGKDTSQAVAKTAIPFEMLPNMPATAYGTNRAQGGDYNEEYDSPDMQNMFLAYAVMDNNNAQRVVLPSYYRPDLLAYWYRRAMRDSTDVGSNSTENYVPLYYSGTSTWSMEAINWDVINSCVQALLGNNAPNVSSGNSEKWVARVECLEAIRGYHVGSHTETESVEWAHFFAVRRFVEWLSFRPADSTFTGSNPNFGLKCVVAADGTVTFQTTGPWDVDNDGDGTPDSVWVDLGLPMQMGPDGRLVQPLAAVLCLDMDGRLNVNAHGHDMQLVSNVINPGDGPFGRGFGPFGRGFGPAEIALGRGLGAPTSLDQLSLEQLLLLDRLLHGDTTQGIEGRLGEWGSSITPVRGGTTLAYNGAYVLTNQNVPTPADGSMAYSNFAAWGQYYPQMLATGVVSGASIWDAYYGLLPDTLGSLYVQTPGPEQGDMGPYGLEQCDMAGNFGLAVMRNNPAALYAANTNYWVDLTTPKRNSSGGKAQIDNPFTPADLERILRMSDADRSTLTARLTTLLNISDDQGSALYRQILTTDSYHVPATPAVELPQYQVEVSGTTSTYTSKEELDLPSRYGSVTEALTRYLRMMESQMSGTGVYSAAVDSYDNTVSVDTMIAGEFYQGLPINPNRRFTDEQYLLDNPGTAIPPADAITAGRTERQAMARQLYVLAKYLTRHWKLDLGTNSDLAKLPGYKKIATLNVPEGKTREDALVSLWLAQWAVNVVDFRDRDSAMTPFWFDPFPDAQTGGSSDQLGWTKDKANLILVFGCERPDLLITETLATHARRTEDTAEDATGKMTTFKPESDADKNFDQKRRPIGSLFVEVYNPWGAGEAAPSPELRPSQDWASAETDVRSVSLNMVNGNGDPVWRMGFRKGLPNDETFELDDPLESGKEFERTLYFAEPKSVVTGSTTGTDGETVDTLRYMASSAANQDLNSNNMWVRPGQAVVIGPYDAEWKTCTPLAKGNNTSDWFDWDETRYIDLYDTQHGTKSFSVWYNYFGDRREDASELNGRDPFNMSNVISIAVDRVDMRETSATSASWKPTGGENPRFSVSEPRKTDSGYGDFYGVKWGSDPMGTDSSKDYYYTAVLSHPVQRDDEEIQKNGLAGQEGLNHPSRYNNRLVYLQRLTDPRLPYNPNPSDEDMVYNPYITVDKAPIDLVTYNGWNPGNDDENNGSSKELIPDDSKQPMESEDDIVLRSRERGYFRQNVHGNQNIQTDLWAQEPILDQIQLGREGTDAAGQTLRKAFTEQKSSPVTAFVDGSGVALSNIQFMPYLSHSLGGVNLCFWNKTKDDDDMVVRPTMYPLDLATGTLAVPSNDPFSVLAWNNSPYNSRMELMQVPVTSMSRLLAAPVYRVDVDDAGKSPKLLEPGYALVNDDDKSESPKFGDESETGDESGTDTKVWQYAGYKNKKTTGSSSEDYADGRWYPHLMNFFDSSATYLETAGSEAKRVAYASNFGQILDFVDTPSAYTGASAWRREPGRVNVNTIPTDTNRNSAVWQALAGTNAASDFEALDSSRQYLSDGGKSQFDGTTPTIFANPVRAMSTFESAFNVDYDPSVAPTGTKDDDYRNWSPSVLNAAQRSAAVNGGNVYVQPQPAFVGLLRPKSAPELDTELDTETDTETDGSKPVLEYHSAGETDQVRNARFRYEQMQRMANLTTDRSSVYAVWVTLGYFEVTGQNAEGKPTLGEEVESSQGIPNRPRAFYMFDRSIPTGYIPGSDISTDRAVLLRRVINE